MKTKFQFHDFAKVFIASIVLFIAVVLVLNLSPLLLIKIQLQPRFIAFIIPYFLQFAVLFIPLYFFVIRKYKTTLSDFGLKPVKLKKLIKIVLLSYLVYISFSISLLKIAELLNIEIPGFGQQSSHIPIFGDNWWGFATAAMFIVLIGPLLEEFFFRGFIYKTFTNTWPVWLASILSAALFALIHFEFTSFIPLFILALILNYNYEKTGSIWTSYAFHALNNAIAFTAEIYFYFHPDLLEQTLALL